MLAFLYQKPPSHFQGLPGGLIAMGRLELHHLWEDLAQHCDEPCHVVLELLLVNESAFVLVHCMEQKFGRFDRTGIGVDTESNHEFHFIDPGITVDVEPIEDDASMLLPSLGTANDCCITEA